MFVTQKRLDRLLRQHDESIRILENKYWDLRWKHDGLLNHLGLIEVEIPAKTELRFEVKRTDKP